MSANNGNGKSAATRRQEALKQKLAIDVYARFPVEHIEFLMDKPPIGNRNGWCRNQILTAEDRVLYAHIRWSWCWPICTEYPCLVDENGEPQFQNGNPIPRPAKMMAEELGMKESNFSRAKRNLAAGGLLRIDRDRAYIIPKPFLTDEARRELSVLISGSDNFGPDTPKKLPKDLLDLIRQVPDQVISTGYLERATVIRTKALDDLRVIRTTEKKGYDVIRTELRILIDQSSFQNSEDGQPSSSPLRGTPPKPEPDPEPTTTESPSLNRSGEPKPENPSVEERRTVASLSGGGGTAAAVAREPQAEDPGPKPDPPRGQAVPGSAVHDRAEPNPDEAGRVAGELGAALTREKVFPPRLGFPTTGQLRKTAEKLIAHRATIPAFLEFLSPDRIRRLHHAGAIESLTDEFLRTWSPPAAAAAAPAGVDPDDLQGGFLAWCKRNGRNKHADDSWREFKQKVEGRGGGG